MVAYEIAPKEWTPSDKNPFTSDGSYGNRWSCFSTRAEFQFRKGNDEFKEHLADFIRYENEYGRTIIIDFEKRNTVEDVVGQHLRKTPVPGARMSTDAKYVVHSTTEESWEKIKSSGTLTAAAFLQHRWNFDEDGNETDVYLKST